MFHKGFTLCQLGLDVRACITECYPERWTSALKDSGSVLWIGDNGKATGFTGEPTGEDVILFRYNGGHFPSFLGKLHYHFTTHLEDPVGKKGLMSPRRMTCKLAWFPGCKHILTLRDLIAHHVVKARTSGIDQAKARASGSSTIPGTGPRWCDALDDALDWQSDLSLHDGTTLSVQTLVEPRVLASPLYKLCFQLQKTDAVSVGG